MRSLTWDAVTLGDVITLKRGYDLPSASRHEGPVPIVSSSGVTGFHNEAKVNGPGVVTGRYGTLGEVFFIEEPFWPLNTTLYVQDFKGNDPRFVSYFLRVMGFSSRSVAAAVPGVNRNDLHRLSVLRPPLPVQRRIASMLSAYDDLIENNIRRIQILEEMAQAIYREWFVEFRFPGHEGVRMVDSEVGPIPEGWATRKLSEEAKVTMGQSPPSSFYNESGEGLPFHQGVTNFGAHFPVHKAFSTSGDRLAEAPDILFSVRAPVGRINVADRDLILGRGLCAIRPSQMASVFLLFQLKHVFRTEDIIGSGSIFNAVRRSDMEGLAVLAPPVELVDRFSALADPAFSLMKDLTFADRVLGQTRDLLLPRLISGEIDVSTLEIGNAEPAA